MSSNRYVSGRWIITESSVSWIVYSIWYKISSLPFERILNKGLFTMKTNSSLYWLPIILPLIVSIERVLRESSWYASEFVSIGYSISSSEGSSSFIICSQIELNTSMSIFSAFTLISSGMKTRSKSWNPSFWISSIVL